jgi:hypothetical protein
MYFGWMAMACIGKEVALSVKGAWARLLLDSAIEMLKNSSGRGLFHLFQPTRKVHMLGVYVF